MTLFIGIDPGLHGAIAIYNTEGVCPLHVRDIPVHELTVNGKKRLQIDKHELSLMLKGYQGARAFVEDVHSMPKQGVASSFKFGFVAGCIQQAVVDAVFELRLVQPNVWKRRFNLTDDKDASRARASELLPAHAHLWPLKKHDGRAEAVLLALYGARYG
jgi:crossover junction endodeoxyribonuclease RuvC